MEATRNHLVSMPSVSGWALRPESPAAARASQPVSMPSVSGWVLRPRRSGANCPQLRCVSMPSVSGWALRLAPSPVIGPGGKFSMPSVSGWSFATTGPVGQRPRRRGFYALGFGLGFATRSRGTSAAAHEFLCPRFRAGLCDVDTIIDVSPDGFYALGVGLGFATVRSGMSWARCQMRVSMPSVSGGLCDDTSRPSDGSTADSGFYALGVGLGFATVRIIRLTCAAAAFLCPRCRAGLCDWSGTCTSRGMSIRFYALGVGLGFATSPKLNYFCPCFSVSMPSVSGWALRQPSSSGQAAQYKRVSMPSVSGGALRRARLDELGAVLLECFYALGVGRLLRPVDMEITRL